MQVLVFKTNLSNSRHVRKMKPFLNVHPQIRRWNVDLQDCDKILRIETDQMQPVEVNRILLEAGYECEIL